MNFLLWKKRERKRTEVKDQEISELEKKAMIFKNLGLVVNISQYKQLPDLLPTTACYFIIYLIALVFYPLNPILPFIFSLLIVICFYNEINGRLILSHFLTLGKKQSLLVKLPSKSSRSKLLFIIPQHYVGLSETYIKTRGYRLIKLLFLLFTYATFVLLLGFFHFVRLNNPTKFYWYIVLSTTLLVSIYVFLSFWKSFFGPQPISKKADYTNNLILATIKKLTQEGELNSLDVYVLFTQDRSGDYSAVVDLLDNQAAEIKGAKIIGLDFFNGESMVISYSEGVTNKYKTSKFLSLAIVGLENKLHLAKIKFIRRLTVFSPITLFLSRGYDGINIISQDKSIGEEYDYGDFFVELIHTLDGAPENQTVNSSNIY